MTSDERLPPPPPPFRIQVESKVIRSIDSPMALRASKIEIIDTPNDGNQQRDSGTQIYVLIYSLIIVAAVMYIFYCIRDKGKFKRYCQLLLTASHLAT